MATDNISAETAFRRRTTIKDGVPLDIYATETHSTGLPSEVAMRYRSEVRALGAIALAVSTLELSIELLALRTSQPGSQAAASATWLLTLWSLVLANAVFLLYRTFDDQWVQQLRKKTQRGQPRLSVRGFDSKDPILWSLLSGALIPTTLLAPGYHHDPVFFAALISVGVGSLAALVLVAGKVRVEAEGLRTANLLSSFDRFIPFSSIRSIEIAGKTVTIVTSNGHKGSTRKRSIRVLGGADSLRSSLVELAPKDTLLYI